MSRDNSRVDQDRDSEEIHENFRDLYEEYHAEWTDSFHLPPADRRTIVKTIDNKVHEWHGIEWSVVCAVEPNQVGLFLGIDPSHKHPRKFERKLKFGFVFINSNGDCIAEGQSTTEFTFTPPDDSRNDRGTNLTFSPSVLLSSSAFRKSRIAHFRVYIDVTMDYLPTPHNLNSKIEYNLVGLANLGTTCYLNALLQTLFHVNKFRRSVYSLPHEGELLNSSTTLALQSTFRNLQLSDREVNTKDLTRAFGWTSSDFFLQQDVQEMMRVLLDKLEEKMKDTPMDGLIRDLFGGNVRSFIKCVNVPFESKREEEFYDIQLDVKGCKTIYDSFSKYTENELMNGENQYDAGENYGKQDAHKGVIFTKFPPVLTIHLKRFDFDMNMMGFMKIHDHFKFPLVLELDQYLAEDSPPESKKVPNKFLLHSVLVHAGDVGGGHYYAYIRPSSSYDYSQTDKVDRDSQWFKFDDEHVTRAREREAVESCFGRRLPESGGYRGMTSSAYMLVYIRQAEAPEIMKHIGDDEIPAGLQQRLDSELKLRKSYERRKALKSMFESYSYISEKLLRKYQKYTKTQDLIHEDCMGYDDLMIDSKMLRVLLDRAKSQRVPPYMLRLWMADRIPQKTAPAIRVIDDILVGDMLKPHQGEKYFLQILDKPGRRSTAESLESLPALKIREDEWLRKLYKVLKELPVNQVLVDTEDESADELLQKVCRGCGIGSSNLPLKEILLYDKRIYTDLLDEISDLEEDMMRFLKINTFHLESDSCLIFMTIFDPNNSLPWLNAAERRSTDLDDDLSKADESSESESGKDSNDISSSDQKQSDSVIVDPYLPEYIPMKYLGYAMLPNITLNNLPDVAMRLLEHRMHEYDVDLPVQWSDHNNFRIHLSESPTKCIFIDLDGKDEERTLQSILRIEREGPLFILDLKESVEDKSDSLLKFGKNSPVEWFKYRSQRREFTVLPFQDADRDALTRLNNIKRLRFLRQPADAADPQLSRVEFICGLPYNISVRVLCQFVAELLCVSQFEIVLYLAQTNLQLYESRPLTVLIEESLYSFIQEGKYNNTATAKYSLFYRLLPFPLGNLGHDNYHYEDLRSRFVYADIRLVDVRIRSLRAEFFKKLHFLAKQRLESAGDPAAKKPRFEDGSESCASLIDEYDISYDIAEELVLLLKSNNSESLTDIGAILQTSDINRLFVRFPMREKVMNCMDKLRSMIDADAIEMNADWMRILSKPIGRQSNSRKVVVQENLVQESIILSSTEFLVNYCNELESTYCVVSDKLIVQETDNPGVVSPSFPLALMEVPHHRIIAKVVPNYLESKALRDTWLNCTKPIAENTQFLLQHVSPEDMICMSGTHPLVRSMVVSVYYFTLLGNSVDICQPDLFSGPFLTYVLETDTYQSFMERVVKITGESISKLWNDSRLAVVRKRVPHFLPRPTFIDDQVDSKDAAGSKRKLDGRNTTEDSTSAADGVTGDQDSTKRDSKESNEEKDNYSLWKYFVEHYPGNARDGDINEKYHSQEIPQVGIQRSVSDKSFANRRRIATGGIRIV